MDQVYVVNDYYDHTALDIYTSLEDAILSVVDWAKSWEITDIRVRSNGELTAVMGIFPHSWEHTEGYIAEIRPYQIHHQRERPNSL
jgi:hypothetical protein